MKCIQRGRTEGKEEEGKSMNLFTVRLGKECPQMTTVRQDERERPCAVCEPRSRALGQQGKRTCFVLFFVVAVVSAMERCIQMATILPRILQHIHEGRPGKAQPSMPLLFM